MVPDTLYDLAFQFRKTKLWKRLYDSQLFAVGHADGGIGYCCVMGMMGEHLALAVYPDDEGIKAYRLMGADRSRMNDFQVQETALSQDCVMLSFDSKSMLRAREIQEVQAYCAPRGLTLRGRKAYPQFQRFRSHRFPWYVDDPADQTRLTEALGAALEVSKALRKAEPEALGFTEGAPFDRKIPLLTKRDGAFHWSEIDLPEPPPIVYASPDVEDELALLRLAKAGRRGGNWACDILMHANPMSDEPRASDTDEPRDAPFYPYLLIIIDDETGEILQMQMSDGPDEYEEPFISAVLDAAVTSGKPRRILVSNQRAHAFFARLAVRMGAKLSMQAQISALDEARDSLYAHLRGEEEEEEEAAAKEKMLRVLRDPQALAEMPGAMLKRLSEMADMGALPDDIAGNVRRECERRGIR